MWSPCKKELTGRMRSGKRKSLKRNKREKTGGSQNKEILNVK